MTLRGFREVNEQQSNIVDSVLGNKVTIATAGAGSGKTYTMIATVMELLRPPGGTHLAFTADQLALVTFTVEAAEQLRAETDEAIFAALTKDPTNRDHWWEQRERLPSAFIGTIHSFAHQLLKDFGHDSTVPRSSTLNSSGTARREAIADALEVAFAGHPSMTTLLEVDLPEYRLVKEAENVLDHLSRVGIDPESVAAATDHAGAHEVTRAFVRWLVASDHAHTNDKVRRGSVDVDDLLLRLVSAFRADPDGASKAARQHPVLFVDEFQDTDRVQIDVIERLLTDLQKLLVVGDVKQSIYGFRAADAKLLHQLAKRLSVKPLPLHVSRRPSRELLDAQNALFSRIGTRYTDLDEKLLAYDGSPTSPTTLAPLVVDQSGWDDVPANLGTWVKELLGTPSVLPNPMFLEPADLVVLCRTNSQADQAVAELTSELAGVAEVRRSRGESFFEQPEVVATLQVLEMLLRPGDDATLAIALDSMYFTDIDARSEIARLVQYGKDRGSPLTDWLIDHHPDTMAWITTCRRTARSDSAPQVLARLYETSGVLDRLRAEGRTDSALVLEDLREDARNVFKREQALTLDAFVEWLRIAVLNGFPSPRDRRGDRRPPYVRVMTIHQSKGMQYPVVFIPWINRALASAATDPHYLIGDDDRLDLNLPLRDGGTTRSAEWDRMLTRNRRALLEEEMRLLYVAVTRAQQQVILLGGRTQPSPPVPAHHDKYSWLDEIVHSLEDGIPSGVHMVAGGPGTAEIAALRRASKPEGATL
ncbi:Exodeoxyribonuclease V beta chain [Euzebya pacifica]|uniref:DNA 3'-5' helicase n=1 Tax=Euzebya pacifica TaxID=1608957 RepID=A0A346XS60_9ACTN|nr:UvrD-helicase domain-containing protein [Euzebya pacifica]AXV05057.1 Exodeoxyribonuclease V beta chain [Euzebya pacifica]